MFWYYYYNLI